MKRLLKWFRKFINEILVLLLIIVIALYIIYFAESVSEKAIDLLVALAAIVSTFFLFLAFWQSKLSNDLKINEPFLNQIEKKILEKETKAKQLVMVEFNKELSQALKTSSIAIQDLSYSSFIFPISTALSHFQENTIYSKFLDLIEGSNKPVLIRDKYDVDDATNISLAFMVLRRGIRAIVYNYIEIYFIYETIDNSSLPIKQKKYFIDRLNEIMHDFNYFFKKQPIEGSATCDSVKFINGFVMFDINSSNQIFRCTNSFEILKTGFDYTLITDKYKND